jgi:radical SAM/Cys-rich protein
MGSSKFNDKIRTVKSEPLKALEIGILQVNLGYRCNMACKHCHVGGGPARTEIMDGKTVEQVKKVFLENPFEVLDITGGAPELHPYLRSLVTTARNAARRVMVRTNLTIFLEQGMEGFLEFYRDHQVEIIASLPYYLEDSVDRVRGSGAFKKSIAALQMLNDRGYGRGPSGLSLSLVYNPQGMFLAPDQKALEAEYKRELQQHFGITFTRLYTFTNMPVGRFRDFLIRANNLDRYLGKLADAFNPSTLDGIMCRHLVNVRWDGTLFDCDFNQVLDLSVSTGMPQHIRDFDFTALAHRSIAVDDHCFGCTAGQGSS